MANWQPCGPFQWFRPLALLKHTTINLGLATRWGRNSTGGDGEVCFVVCILELWLVGEGLTHH